MRSVLSRSVTQHPASRFDIFERLPSVLHRTSPFAVSTRLTRNCIYTPIHPLGRGSVARLPIVPFRTAQGVLGFAKQSLQNRGSGVGRSHDVPFSGLDLALLAGTKAPAHMSS
jgi:hypothetical protein